MKTTRIVRSTRVTTSLPATGLLSMKEAIALLGTTQPTFYRWLREGRLTGLRAGRQWRFKRSDLDRFLKGEGPSRETPGLERLVTSLLDRLKQLTSTTPPAGGDTAQQVITLLFHLGHALGASDIHLEPGDPQGRIRYRIDGLLQECVDVKGDELEPLAERLLTLCHCNIQRKSLPQDGRLRLTVNGNELNIRLCFLPAIDGTAVTARLWERNSLPLTLDRLQLQPEHRAQILHALARPYGLVLVSGPAGSGKTTTLHACLQQLIRPGVKVITVEDPVEYRIPGTLQMRVRHEDGMTFESAVRAMLRSDPDVLMVSEIRTRDVASLCHQSALTGHLVLSALHAPDAPATLRRLIDLGVPPLVVAETLGLVVAQRLLRRLCPDCREMTTPSTVDLERAREIAAAGGLDWSAQEKHWYAARGCPHCRQFGYRGRLAVTEVLPIQGAVLTALLADATIEQLSRAARSGGCVSLGAEALRWAALGESTLEEALRLAVGT